MTIPIPGGSVTNLRKTKHSGTPNLSVFKPTTILAAQVNGAHDRGARSIAYDNGTGTFSLIRSYQSLWVGTAPGRNDIGIIRIKSITGTAASGTITVDENGIPYEDGYYLTIKHHYGAEPVPPRISNKIFYKFFSLAYSDQNSEPPPVCLEKGGAAQVGRLVAGSLVFDFDLTDSYAIADGATIASYGLTVAPAAGATVSFNTGTGIGTITVTTEGEWWATASAADSNGKTQELFIALKADNSPYTDYQPNSYDAGYGQGVQLGFTVFGNDLTLAQFPDEALVVEWYDGYFNDVADYVNIYDAGDNILTVAYIRSDTASDDFAGQNRKEVTFRAETIDNILDNIYLNSVSLEAVTSPGKWYQYARWLTVGRAIHHLLKWHSPIMELIGVRGLTSNTLRIKGAKFEGGATRQMANTLANERGIFAQLTADRLGRLHLARDSQMLNQAARDLLPTILEISEEDVSGPIRTVRQPEGRAYAAQLSGFSFDGSLSTPFVSMIPGYRESNVSYGIPARRGSQFINKTNQVLASQTDSNEKVGRAFAVANMPIKEFNTTFRGNYIGALTCIPTEGWYDMGIANTSLGRELQVNGIRLVCRRFSLSVRDGDFVTSAVFEPEAIGPDGIQGNYPTSMPPPPNPPAPRWDVPGSLPALVSFSSVYYRDEDDAGWTQLNTGSYNHGAVDPWWKVKEQTTDPHSLIWWGVGEAGLVARTRGVAGSPVDLTPVSNPPNTWSDGTAPTVAGLSLIQVLPDTWIESRFYILARMQFSGNWRGWLLATSDDGNSYSYVTLYNGVTLPGQVRPLWAAVNGSHLLVTVWTSSNNLRLLKYNPSTLAYVSEYTLGSSTLAELDANTYVARPATAIDDDDLWYVYGRMNAPQALANPEQVIVTDDSGASWASFEAGWGANYCKSLAVGTLSGSNRDYWAVRSG